MQAMAPQGGHGPGIHNACIRVYVYNVMMNNLHVYTCTRQQASQHVQYTTPETTLFSNELP